MALVLIASHVTRSRPGAQLRLDLALRTCGIHPFYWRAFAFPLEMPSFYDFTPTPQFREWRTVTGPIPARGAR